MINNYCIYLHRNKINGKCYIGQTRKNPEYRWNNGKGYINSTYFYRAILAYGWDSFEHIILKSGLTHEEADLFERELIEKYQSTNSDYGYNLEAGGNVAKTIPESTRQKMKNNHADVSGKNNPMYGKVRSEVTRKKIGDSHRGKYDGANNPNYGNHKLAGANHPMAKQVFQYKPNGEFVQQWEYAKLAAEKLGINYSNICECCKGKRKRVGGYVWRYD